MIIVKWKLFSSVVLKMPQGKWPELYKNESFLRGPRAEEAI